MSAPAVGTDNWAAVVIDGKDANQALRMAGIFQDARLYFANHPDPDSKPVRIEALDGSILAPFPEGPGMFLLRTPTVWSEEAGNYVIADVVQAEEFDVYDVRDPAQYIGD